jgi:hypothetical protein
MRFTVTGATFCSFSRYIEPGTGRKARSFTRWSRLVHLLSMQLTVRVSLRGGVSGLKARIKRASRDDS